MKSKNLVTILFLLLCSVSLLFAGGKKERGTEEGFAGKTLNFLTIQPHNVASTNLAAWFEEESGAKVDRKSTRLNSSHIPLSRMPSSA